VKAFSIFALAFGVASCVAPGEGEISTVAPISGRITRTVWCAAQGYRV